MSPCMRTVQRQRLFLCARICRAGRKWEPASAGRFKENTFLLKRNYEFRPHVSTWNLISSWFTAILKQRSTEHVYRWFHKYFLCGTQTRPRWGELTGSRAFCALLNVDAESLFKWWRFWVVLGRCRVRISLIATAILTTVLRDLPQSLEANFRILHQLKHNLLPSNLFINSSFTNEHYMVCKKMIVLALISGMKIEHFIYLLI